MKLEKVIEEVEVETNHHTGIGHPLGQSTTSQSRLALSPGEDSSRANHPLDMHSTLKSLHVSHSKHEFTFNTLNPENGQLPTLQRRLATENKNDDENENDVSK